MPAYYYLDDMTHPIVQLFGQRVRAKRQELQMSQGMLFERTGISASYISHLERGKGNPSLDVMIQICEVLGCPVWEMLAPAKEADDTKS